jgi:hypothetical protein
MPYIEQIERWNNDPEYNALSSVEKQAILEDYFDSNLSDNEFLKLPEPEQVQIKSDFVQYHIPQDTQPRTPPQPEETALDATGRVLRSGLKGVAEGLTTELPAMIGRATEFVGSGIPGDITSTMRETTAEYGGDPSRVPTFEFDPLRNIGKDLKDWAELKRQQWFGSPKKREGLEQIVYEGTKMLAPSVLPAAIIGTGVRALKGVGGLVKAAKAAELAGDAGRAMSLMDKANKAANLANTIASSTTASMFGLSQAQQTKDTAEEQAVTLEGQGKFEEAKEVRAYGQGLAPLATGTIEAAGEYFGTKYLGKLFRLDEAGIAKRGAKNLVKDFIKTLGVEVSTEVGQQLGEATIEKVTGIRPEADPLSEALDVIGPTAFMTLLTGGAGGVMDIARHSTDSINLLQEEQEQVAPDKDAVNINLIKKTLKEFREEATGPPSTALESAATFARQEAYETGRLERMGLQVPEFKPAEESARVFEEQLPIEEEVPERPPVEPPFGPPSTAEEAAKVLVGPEAVEEERERERIQRRGLEIPEVDREQIEKLGLRIPEIKSAKESAEVFKPTKVESMLQKAVDESQGTGDEEKIDILANEAATSPINDLPEPTEAQKKAGNYKKGAVNLQGMDISIENPKGSERTGIDSDGETWSTTMQSHYGYIKGTVGKDKDHLDIFIGDNPNKDNVYVVDQINPDTGKFDEHKVLIGFGNMREARKGYLENYDKGWKGLGAITKMPVEEFKEWSGDKAKTQKPLKFKEAKRATQIRGDEGRVLREKEARLEKEERQAAIDTDEKAVAEELKDEGRQDIQRPEEAGREARDRVIPDKTGGARKEVEPRRLSGVYVGTDYTIDDYMEPARKLFAKDVKAYAKQLQEYLGYEPNLVQKGRSKLKKNRTVSINVAPSGGEGNITLWKPDSKYGVYVSTHVNRDTNDNFVGKDTLMYRIITRDGKIFSRNQWASSDLTASELAEKIKNMPGIDTAETKEAAKEPTTEKKQEAASKAEATPESRIAGQIVEILDKESTDFTSRQLFALADKEYDGTQAEGAYTPKDAYDAMELAVNKWIARKGIDPSVQVTPGYEAKTEIPKLRNLLERLATQTRRTAETDQFQQFSTPPHISYLANWVANLQDGETYLEPSAGIGGLAVFGKNAGANVIVNELSERRRTILKEIGFSEVYGENAEQIHNILSKDIKPTVIVMNPPFSVTAGRLKKTSSMVGFRHLEQALLRLEPNGRLVAILGKGVTDTAAFKNWWKNAGINGIIRADIGISGKEYKKYGTTYGNQLIVIDKIADAGQEKVTGEVSKVEDAINLLKGVRHERATRELPTPKPESEGLPSTRRPSDTARDIALSTVSPMGIGRGRVDSAVSDRTDVEGEPVKRPSVDDELTTDAGKRGSDRGRGEPKYPDRTGMVDTGQADRLVESGVKLGKGAGQKRVKQKELTDSVYEEYKPQKVKISGAGKHPGSLVESAAMSAVDPPDANYTPNLPKDLISQNKLSLSQLESIVYAGQAHGGVLPTGERKGFFIGDGTGVGKGREISGILLDNYRQGRKKAIWISQNSPLIEDAKRDVAGIDWDPKLVFDVGRTKMKSALSQKQGIAFLGYDLLRGFDRKDNTITRINQLIEWVGDDFDGVIVFDESHNLGNALAIKGKRGNTKPSKKALAGVDLQRLLPNARVVYVSATGATEVMNLSYADRLGLWGEGTAFAGKEDFVEKISAGGIAAMELIARDMKSMGNYLSRSLSYDGVKYDKMQHILTPEQRGIYDEYSNAWQLVLKDVEAAIAVTEASSKAKSSARAQFWGSLQRFFNQVITSMQTPSMINAIEKDVAAGHSAVIQLVNTNESGQNRAIAKLEEDQLLEEVDITPRELLMNYVENSFPVNEYQIVVDEDGNERSVMVVDSQGNPVQNSRAAEMREKLLDKLGSIRGIDNPLDMIINHFGVKQVAEVTGRTRRIVEGKDKKGTKKKVIEKRSKAKAMVDADAFMNDRKKVLIFSNAGGTGRSYHASLESKNQRLRRHYLLQAGWVADKAIQGFGRSHRTNQAQPPEYVLVTTDIAGQKRFISSIARRLGQLGALTKGQREAGSGGFFDARDNLESEYASDALGVLVGDIYNGKVEGMDFATFVEQTGLEKLRNKKDATLNTAGLPPVTQFLNRLLAMSIDNQSLVFEEFSKRIDANVRRAMESGNLDVGMETMRAKNIKKASEQVVHTDEQTGAESKYVELAVSKDAKILEFDKIPKTRKAGGHYKNNKSGKVWAAGKLNTKTDPRTGSLITYATLIGPSYNTNNVLKDVLEDKERYTKISDQVAKKLWDAEYEKLPKVITYKEHMITGSLLPIWDRLPTSSTRIMRVQTDTGERMIGRLIEKKSLDDTLRRLGAQVSKEKVTPKELFDKVLHQGFKAELSNGWRIERRRVSGEQRIELVGPDYRFTDQLAGQGVFTERINWQTRYFVPTSDNGVDTIRAITSNRAVINVDAPINVKEDMATEQFSVEPELTLGYTPAGEKLKRSIPTIPTPESPKSIESLPLRTADLIETVFPNQEVQPTKTGFEITLKNGLKIRVDRVTEIVLAEKETPAVAEGEYIAGVYTRTPGGKTAQIKVSTQAGTKTLHHESIHFLEDFGVITKQEVGRINRHIKQSGQWNKSKSAAENRAEWLANKVNKPAPKTKIGRLWKKITDFVSNLINKFGIKTIGGVVREVKTGKVFERPAGEDKIGTPENQYSVERENNPAEEDIDHPGLLRRQFDELVYNMQDKFNYLNKAQRAAERRNRAELPEEQDAYLAETRYHGMAAAAIEDFQEEYVNPILELMSSNDIDIAEADEYLHARHAKEANARLKEINPDRENNEALSGMTDIESNAILNGISSSPKAEAFQSLGEMVDQVTKAQRDILRESGLESEETIKQWENTYKYYVPLMREGKSEGKMPRRGRGFDIRGKQPIRAGSTRAVVNVLAHAVANTEAAMVRAEKAKVSRAFLAFAQENPGPWEIDTVEYKARFNNEGMIEYRPDPLYRPADNVMIVKTKDGVNHRIIFDESNLNAMRIASAMKNLDAQGQGELVRILSKTTRWLAMVNTSLNPEFIISNFFRDIQTAGYNMSDSVADKVRLKVFKDVKSAWRGIRDFQKGSKDTEWAKWYDQYRKAGAQVGWAENYRDIIDREKKMISEIKNMHHGNVRTIKRGLNSVMRFIENENTAVENAVRLSIFKNLIESGVPEGKAAFIAKESTVNFNRKGAMGQAINSLYLFYNASIQGSTRIIQAAVKSPKVRKLMAGTVAFAAALDVLNRAVGGKDDDGEDRYDKIAPWIKERNMIIMLPDDKGYAQIPLPWGYNIFHVMGQSAGEAITKKDYSPLEGAARIAGATISSFNPVGGEASILQVLSPSITDPIVQWAENKDWTGRKLRPDANIFSTKPSSQIYWSSVREPSRVVAEKLNELTGGDVIKPGKIDISPEAIDLAINTFTGSAGKFVANLISTPIKAIKGEDIETYEVPIFRRLYGRTGKQALSSDFYENMDAVQLVYRQLKYYQNDKKKIKEIKMESAREVSAIRAMKATKKALNVLRKAKKAVMKIQNPQRRKKKLKGINNKMQWIMKNFNSRYKQFKEREE